MTKAAANAVVRRAFPTVRGRQNRIARAAAKARLYRELLDRDKLSTGRVLPSQEWGIEVRLNGLIPD